MGKSILPGSTPYGWFHVDHGIMKAVLPDGSEFLATVTNHGLEITSVSTFSSTLQIEPTAANKITIKAR